MRPGSVLIRDFCQVTQFQAFEGEVVESFAEVGTIQFTDAERGAGVFIVRRASADDRVSLCISLAEDGDVEVLVSAVVAREMLTLMEAALRSSG
jgi:hypothetical protein